MRKNRLIALIGTLTMAAAGLAAVSAGVSSKKAEGVSAAINKGQTIFIRNDGGSSGGWLADGAKLKLNCEDTGGGWHNQILSTVQTIVNSDSYIFKFTLPSDWNTPKNLQILRMDSSGASQWNWSNTISVSGASHNLFVLDSSVGDGGSHFSESSASISKITLSQTTGGTISCNVNEASTDVPSGSYVYSDHWFQLKATANNGYNFKNWKANGSDFSSGGTNNPVTLEGVASDTTFSAVFEPKSYTVSTGTLVDCTCNVASSGIFDSNLAITLTKGSQTGYDFSDSISYTIKSGDAVLTSGTATSGTPFNYKMTGTYYPSITIDATCEKTPQIYTISYNPGDYGSGSISSGSKTYGSDATLSSSTFTSSRDRFTQTGWSRYDGGPKAFNLGGTYSEESAITLYPFWTETSKPTYTISIAPNNGDYGSVSATTLSIEEDSTISVDENTITIGGTTVTATKNTNTEQYSYEFTGWTGYSSPVKSAQNIVANFRRTTNNYTISIVSNDEDLGTVSESSVTVPYGTSISTNGATLTIGDENITATANNSTDYYSFAFSSWSNASGIVTDARTITANFVSTELKYTLNFNNNGGSGTMSSFNRFVADDVDLPKTTFSKAGYTFDGWILDSTSGDADYRDEATILGHTFASNSVHTLYAKWKANEYTVTLDDNGGTGGQGTVGATYDSNIENVDVPTNYGKTFKGYFDAQTGGTKYINNDGTGAKAWNKTSNTTLYAQWTLGDGYYVHVYGDSERFIKMSGDGEVSTAVSLADQETFKVTHVVNGVETSWHGFTELKYDSGDTAVDARTKAQIIDDGTDNHNMKANLPDTNTFTVYYKPAGDGVSDPGIYIPSIVNVVFDLNGVTGTGPANQIVNSRGLVTEPEDPEAENHEFLGWYSDALGTTEWDFSTFQVVYFTTDSEHVATQKIYAKWKSTMKYQIILNNGDGSAQPSLISDVLAGDPISVNPVPTLDHYTFDGYWTTASGDGTKVINADGSNAVPYDPDFGLTLYARYSKEVYTIKFVNYDDTELASYDVEYNEMPEYAGDQPAKVDVEKTYEFDGWDKEITVATEDTTYTATFKETGYVDYAITIINSDERGGQNVLHGHYGETIDASVLTNVLGDDATLPLGREYVGLKLNSTSQETPITSLTFDPSTQGKTFYACYTFVEADTYTFDVDGGTPVNFTRHENADGCLQLYTGTVESVGKASKIDINTSDGYPVVYDESSNFTPDGLVKHETENATLSLKLMYKAPASKLTRATLNEVEGYYYLASLSGLPNDNKFYLSVNGILTEMAKNPIEGTNEYYVQGIEINKDEVIDAYCNQYYNISLDSAVDCQFFVESDGKVVCVYDDTSAHKYDAYLKYKDNGYTELYIAPQGFKDANDYAEKFLNTLSTICPITKDATKVTKKDLEDLEAAWGELGTAFTELSGFNLAAVDWLEDATGDERSQKAIEKFAALYDYVVGKYGFTNFVGRTASPQSSSRKLISINDISSSTWIVASVSLIGIAAVGVFFVYKKRKEI